MKTYNFIPNHSKRGVLYPTHQDVLLIARNKLIMNWEGSGNMGEPRIFVNPADFSKVFSSISIPGFADLLCWADEVEAEGFIVSSPDNQVSIIGNFETALNYIEWKSPEKSSS